MHIELLSVEYTYTVLYIPLDGETHVDTPFEQMASLVRFQDPSEIVSLRSLDLRRLVTKQRPGPGRFLAAESKDAVDGCVVAMAEGLAAIQILYCSLIIGHFGPLESVKDKRVILIAEK